MLAHHLTLRVDDPELLREFSRIRKEFRVPIEFSPQVEAAATAAVPATPWLRQSAWVDRRDIEFLTIDPDGARDLDQAFAAGRTAAGFRVFYAIADVAAFVGPGTPLDAEARERGATMFTPDFRATLHPVALNEGAASLLPGVDRPAVLWTITVDDDGTVSEARAERAIVRSREALSYPAAQREIDSGAARSSLALLREIGERRIAQEAARGAVSLTLPAQTVERADGAYVLTYEQSLPVEKWNAQISLMTGMAAAQLQVAAKIGLLRTMPEADRRDIDQLRRVARSLHLSWPGHIGYPAFVRSLPDTKQAQAFMADAARTIGGASYTVFRGSPPTAHTHSALAAVYSHATAPLRRVGDRFVNEIALAQSAGRVVPEWVEAGLDGLPRALARANQRQQGLDRAAHDLLEAILLSNQMGKVFEATVETLSSGHARIRLDDLAVVATLETGRKRLSAGATVMVELVAADVTSRTITFAFAKMRR